MGLYIDTSVFLKLFFVEPESGPAAAIVAREPEIVVSSLTRLEAVVQVKRRIASGCLSMATATNLVRQLEGRIRLAPFEFRRCPAALPETAQCQALRSRVHCSTLDRLHLAAMEAFGLRRLLTNDDRQAAAARELGFDAVFPR